MSKRRVVLWFVLGLVGMIGLAEGVARIAEATGPPSLRWYDASSQLKVAQMESASGADVVFAGTSMAWQGLVPNEFTTADTKSRSAYNAGLAGGVPVVMEPWLLEEVVPRLQPGTVVWGLSSMDFSTSYGEDNLERYRDALSARTGLLADVEQTFSRFSALVRYRTILRSPSALFGTEGEVIERDFRDAAGILGAAGERLDFSIGFSQERAAEVQARLRDFRLDPNDIDALERTVDALRDRGTEVVFAIMPTPLRYAALHPEGATDVARADEAVMVLGELLGVPVIDLRHGFTDDDFVDFTHLDAAGAARLTRSLAEALPGAEPPAPPLSTSTSTTIPVVATTDPAPTTTTTTSPTIPTDQLLATSRRAIEVSENLYRQLLGGGASAETAAYWTSDQHRGHHGDLANGVKDGSYDLVFVGSSLVVNGLDPVLTAESTGRRVFNASIAALTPEDLDIWLDSVVRLAQPNMVIYGTETRDVRILGKDPESCEDTAAEWVRSEEIRAAIFGTVDAYGDLWWENLMFGDPIAFEASDWYRSRFNEVGGRIRSPQDTVAEIDTTARRTDWDGAFPLCAPRIDTVAANVAELKDQGIAVVVVFMPISDWRADQFDGGREEAAEITALMRDAVVAAGADAVLDYSGLLSKDLFSDLVHANDNGRRLLTETMLEDLNSLGL